MVSAGAAATIPWSGWEEMITYRAMGAATPSCSRRSLATTRSQILMPTRLEARTSLISQHLGSPLIPSWTA